MNHYKFTSNRQYSMVGIFMPKIHRMTILERRKGGEAYVKCLNVRR